MHLLDTKQTSPPDAGLRLRATAIGVLLLVAACVTTEEGQGSSTKEDAGASDTGNIPVGQTGAAPAAASNGGGGNMAAAGVRRIGARNPERYDPKEFLGYQPERLLPVLGAPDFVRRDGTAQIWQYRAENCVFDLFLYGDDDSSRVAHVDLRERRATDEPVEACFLRMRADRKPKSGG